MSTVRRSVAFGRFTAGAALAMLLTPMTATASGLPRLTPVSRATAEDLAPSRTYSAPNLVADPDEPTVVFGAVGDLRSRTCRLVRSTDAGQNWRLLDASPSPSSYPFCTTAAGMMTQTPIAWGRDRTLYYAMSGWDTQDGGPAGNVSVILARSTDSGASWTSTVVRDARGKTGQQIESNSAVSSLVVDSTSGAEDIVYVGWRATYPQAPAFPGGERPLRPPLVATSTDGGKTFGDPVDVSSFYKKTLKGTKGDDLPIGMAFSAPSLALDERGTLYVAYPAAAPTVTPASAAPKQPMLLARSTDKGKTFTMSEVTPPLLHNEGVQILKWGPGGGDRGTLHLIFEDKPDQPQGAADRDIYYTRSTDEGRTFAKAIKLNDDDPTQLRTQVTPNLSVAPNGRIDAVWWDFRNDPGTFVNDVYGTHSTDNGITWSGTNTRLTDQSVNRKLGVWSNGYDVRQPPGVASTDKLTYVGWDDTRLGNAIGDLQDVFARTEQFEPLGGGGSALGPAVAVFASLAVVGTVLLLVSRRRSDQPSEQVSSVTATVS